MTGAQKRLLAAAIGVVLLAAARQPWHWWALTGWVAVCGALWVIRLKRHPLRPCLLCKGTGRNWGSDETQQGDCPRCLKTLGPMGKEPRLGAALLHPELRRNR